MKSKDMKKGEIIAHILSSMDENLECETDYSNLPSMGRSTAFSVLKEMGTVIEHQGDARYRLKVPRRVLRQDRLLVSALDETIQALHLLGSATEKLLPYAAQRFEERAAACGACEHYEKCMEDEEVECPFQSKVGPVQGWTGMIYSLRDQDQEEEASPRLDQGGGSGVLVSMKKGGRGATALTRRDARALMGEKLAESRAAKKDAPPSMLQQKRELRTEWVRLMAEVHGLSAAPWGGKEHKLVPKLLGQYGLELTKRAVRLYFESWDNIRAENAWISENTPTFGMFWHFREMVFAVVQGKGVIGGKSRKRTADECHDDDKYTGGWGDADEEASSPSA